MHFELLQLYRNYRNIKDIGINNDSTDDNFVFGHFEHLKFQEASSAENALDLLYNQNIEFDKTKKTTSDVQPIILFSYGSHTIQPKVNKCMVVSFMQLERPNDCDTIKKFYEYSVSIISETIEKAKKHNLIGDITANVYIPLNFMDIAVIFCAEDFNDVCIIVKNIMHNKLARFQYSVLSLNEKFDFNSNKLKSLNISLRFIWDSDYNVQEAINTLKQLLEQLEITNYSINHLMGNNDCLLVIPQKGYAILKEYISPSPLFSEFVKKVENSRASISFDCDDINFFEINNNIQLKTSFKFDYDDIISKENELVGILKSIKQNLSILEQSEISDIMYRVREFGKFVNVIREHATKGIAAPLYISIEKTYILFLEIAIESVKYKSSTYKSRNNVLQIIGNHLNNIMSYYNNIFHCNLGFFEERGFYNNIIGLASDVELAYNQYANLLCDVIMCDDEKNVQNLKIGCIVTSDNEPTICTNDVFGMVKTQDTDKESLININIPVSYVFKNKYVSYIIIHEIAHYVGCRNRQKRAESICMAVSSVICDAIYQSFSVPYGTEHMTESEIKICNQYEKTPEYNKIHKKMQEDINDMISTWFVAKVFKLCNGSFYMSNLLNAIVDSLNLLRTENDLVEKIIDVLVEFKFWYYEYFEDYYLLNRLYENTAITGVIKQLSDYSIKDFYKNFIKITLEKVFDYLLNSPINEDDSKSDERFCFLYIVNLSKFIKTLCSATTEAYSDIMMVTLSKMTFDDYYELMKNYGKSAEEILANNDYMTWLRVNFVASYMGNNFFEKFKLSEKFKIYKDLNVINHMHYYFESLENEMEKASIRCQSKKVLNDYIASISTNKNEVLAEAIYNMFFAIISQQGEEHNG